MPLAHYAELAYHLALTELWNECMTSSLGNSAARGKTASIARSNYTLHITEPFFRLQCFSLVWGARQLLRGLRVWWGAWVQNEVSEIETDLKSYKLPSWARDSRNDQEEWRKPQNCSSFHPHLDWWSCFCSITSPTSANNFKNPAECRRPRRQLWMVMLWQDYVEWWNLPWFDY